MVGNIRRSAVWIACCGVLLSAGICTAQEPRPPPPELKKLEFMVGKFAGVRKSSRTMREIAIRYEAEWVSRGFVLQSIVVMPDGSRTPALWTFDRQEGPYHLYFFSAGSLPIVSTGKFEGGKLVLLHRSPQMDLLRSTMEPVSPNEFRVTLEQKPAASGDWQRVNETVYKRAP